jgi:hypothetical protein
MALHKKAFLAVCVACLCITAAPLALASERPAVSRESLMSIARQFVTRVGGKLDRVKSGQAGTAADPDALTLIPDGETLLFFPKVGKLQYQNEVAAIKKSNNLYVSLEDFISVLELALEYDPERQRARGWYLREDWPVNIDVPQKKVFYRDKQFTIATADTITEEGKLYISQQALTTWLDLDMDFVLEDQYVELKTPYPLPAVAREERKNQEISTRDSNIAQLPRKQIEYDWLDINTSDVNLRSSLSKRESGSNMRNTGTVSVEGQALKHEAYAFATYDRDEGVTGVTARLHKENEDPVLLGKLKARSYTIGDTTTTDIPLTGSSSQEAGFRVSNNPLQNADFQTTDVNGDALPGWEVELYRSGVLVGRQIVPDNGFYEFKDVQLYAGDNDFEVQFYGPQGERRSETLEVPVTSALLATQNNTYDVSVSLAESQVYEVTDNNDEDKDTPHLAARYNTFIGDTLVYGGLRARQVEGEAKAIAGTGFTNIWQNTLFDGNFALDESGEMAAQLAARKNIFDWQLATSALVQTDEFAPNGEGSPQTLGLTASAIKQFMPPIGTTATFGIAGRYRENADGTSTTGGNIDYSHQIGMVTASNTLEYQKPDGGAEEAEDRLNNAFSVRAHYRNASARAGVNYQIKPDAKAERYFADVNYRPTDRLTADVGVVHQPENNFSEVEAALNYRHDKFRAAPFVQYDTDHELFAGMNVNFSLVKPPNEMLPTMTSQRLTGRGLVSSFVYHDKNGNEIFDTGDEPLPDVVVESMNIKRRELTDKKGYSLIKDLPPTRATDIHVDNSSLPDPFMISGFDGVSIFPSAGEIVELEFPIHLAGEIDGVVGVIPRGGGSPVGERVTLEFLPIDGKAKKKLESISAMDGYYTVSQVPPGIYLVSVAQRSAQRIKAGMITPQIIKINYDGTVLSQDVRLAAGTGNVSVKTQMVLGGVAEGVPAYTMKIRQGGKTELMSLLRRFATARASKTLFAGLQPVDTVGDKEPQVSYYRLPDNNLENTYKRCQKMVEKGVSCEMVVFVRDRRAKPIKTASAE